jgi:hypothetical protein
MALGPVVDSADRSMTGCGGQICRGIVKGRRDAAPWTPGRVLDGLGAGTAPDVDVTLGLTRCFSASTFHSHRHEW